MTLHYSIRLACLCFAAFFAAQFAAGAFVWVLARYVERVVRAFSPRNAARLLLMLRIAPACLGAFIVVAICLPSYLWLEPAATTERVGLLFCSGALAGAWLCATALFRTVRASLETILFASKCRNVGKPLDLPRAGVLATVLDEETATLALAGVFRSQILISRRVVEALSAQQLELAISHEKAHRTARDNFKRALMLLAPDFFPFNGAFRAIERAWRKVSEWAADDAAVAKDPERSVTLAGALVRVARISKAPKLSPLCTTLVPGRTDLVERVERLLNPRPTPREDRYTWRLIGSAWAAGLLGAAIAFLRPHTLHAVHELMERLIH